ncbi:MAG TPA: phosphate transport system regulatory protein PhoU [Clostridiales bacterium]|nr:phosphate transport system regulatory protein PhoU [Clostridiales bacterium]
MATRVEFTREMSLLHQEIIRMGATVENAITEAIAALTDMDPDKAAEVIKNDDVIDEMERLIDKHCVAIIARQQPVASDLRDVTSTLKLITDLERIADHASDICERILEICKNTERITIPHEIVTIANLALNMLHGALDAYVAHDEEKATSVISMDDKVDDLYNRLKSYLVHLMSVDSANVGQLVEMLLIAKYVERIADHAQNVAEWVVFHIQGRYYTHDV